MSQIHLLRHGQACGGNYYRGSTNDPLTELGWQQMRNAISQQQWDIVVSSPLLRCLQFAEQFCQKNQLPLQIETDLQEYNFGEWEGKSSKTLFEQTPEAITRFWQNPYEYYPPGAETMSKFEQRVLRTWQKIRNENSSKRILVITHGGVIRVILRHVFQRPREELLKIEVPLASLVAVQPQNSLFDNA